MAPTGSTEPKDKLQTLPAGHPQAGYVSPPMDIQDGTGTLPDTEQEQWDERLQANEDETKTVAEGEDTAAKAEAEEAAKSTEAPADPGTKSSTTTKSTSSSSSGS